MKPEPIDQGAAGPQLPRLLLYSRSYCHLCDEMLAGLQALGGFDFEVEVIDVDADPHLESRFGDAVPLLMHGEVELARYRIEPARIRAYLSEMR